MTEAIIIALLLTGAVWLGRVCQGAWCKFKGVEHDTSGHGPLPIVHAWHLVRAWWGKICGWVRRKPNTDSGSTQAE